jgi:deoxycytidine triphosphate deaminase
VSVLGDRDISRRFDEIFEEGTAAAERIRAAKYDLTLGDRLLILPDGRRYSDDPHGRPRQRPFVLEPGQSVLISTRERISMPTDLSGILGPAFDLSDEGILFFGGMLVDPGFGLRKEGERWVRFPEPLSFYLANVGSGPLQLRPGGQRVASIAFLEVTNARTVQEFDSRFETTTARKVRAELFDPKCEDPPPSLGLVRDISELDHRVDKFEASTFHVVVFGVIVLAVTLFAAIVSLVVSEPAAPVVSDLEIKEVLLVVGLVVLELLGIVAVFYLAMPGVVWAPRKWHALHQKAKGAGT